MRDEWFTRGAVPMTKSEVRAVSISKLELKKDSVLWDIGAGTGSVSVEAAYLCPDGQVCAFERNPEAVELIKENCRKAGHANLMVVHGTAPECLTENGTPDYEKPEGEPKKEAFEKEKTGKVTHVFLGGTGGKMDEILDVLFGINPEIRIVINVIALESLAGVLTSLKNRNIEPEIISLTVARAERAGSVHLMKGQNPVYIISFGGKQ